MRSSKGSKDYLLGQLDVRQRKLHVNHRHLVMHSIAVFLGWLLRKRLFPFYREKRCPPYMYIVPSEIWSDSFQRRTYFSWVQTVRKV